MSLYLKSRGGLEPPTLPSPGPDSVTAAAAVLDEAWLRGSRVSRAQGTKLSFSAGAASWGQCRLAEVAGFRRAQAEGSGRRPLLRLRRGGAFPQARASPRRGPAASSGLRAPHSGRRFRQAHEASGSFGLAAAAARTNAGGGLSPALQCRPAAHS